MKSRQCAVLKLPLGRNKKTTKMHLQECMIDERPSSWSLQHVVQAILQFSVALTRSGRVGSGSRGSGQRSAQQTGAVRRVSALRAGRLASLRVDGGESHKLHPPVVVRSRGHEHSDSTVV